MNLLARVMTLFMIITTVPVFAQTGTEPDSAQSSSQNPGIIGRFLQGLQERRTARHEAAQPYFDYAQRMYQSGDYSEALEAVKQAVKTDPAFAEAYNLQAKILLQSEDWQDWVRAVTAAQTALKYDWTNPGYHFTLADIYERQCSWHLAADQYKRVLHRDSTNVEAHFRLGLFYRNERYFYQTMVSVESPYQLFDRNLLSYYRVADPARNTGGSSEYRTYDATKPSPSGFGYQPYASYESVLKDQFTAVGMIRFDKFGGNLYDQAREQFQKTLALDPDHWQALIQLGMLGYETEDDSLLRACRKKLLQFQDVNKDVELFLGLTDYKLAEYDAADQWFRRAFKHLSREERLIYESPLYLLPAEGPEAQDSEELSQFMTSIDYRPYWRSRDPLFLSEENERLEAHYARCAYAHFRFGFPPRDIEGLHTDRGKVYIRYGEPLRIARKRPEVAGHYYEIWYYPNRTFAFDDPWGDGRTGYNLGSDFYGVDFREVAAHEFKNNPSEYHLTTRGQVRAVPCQVVSFRGKSGSTDLEFYYGLPVDSTDFRVVSDGFRADFDRGLFLFDEDWNSLFHHKDSIEIRKEMLPDSSGITLETGRLTASLNPGAHPFSLEFRNPRSDNVGLLRGSIGVPSYRGDSLLISDLLLASDIKSTRPGAPDRQTMSIDPNPTKEYASGKMIHLYYEIYNLDRSPERGVTRYGVTTSVATRQDSVGGLRKVWRGMKRMIGLSKKERSVSTYSEYEGASATEHQYSVVDISGWRPGVYVLSLEVKDLNTGERVRKQVNFRITGE